jgi:hypothetical protein
MAIAVGNVRTPTMKARMGRLGGFFPDNACELCMKVLGSTTAQVAIDHETYEFVTVTEAQERGDAVSLFSVGADCARRIRRALVAAEVK